MVCLAEFMGVGHLYFIVPAEDGQMLVLVSVIDRVGSVNILQQIEGTGGYPETFFFPTAERRRERDLQAVSLFAQLVGQAGEEVEALDFCPAVVLLFDFVHAGFRVEILRVVEGTCQTGSRMLAEFC